MNCNIMSILSLIMIKKFWTSDTVLLYLCCPEYWATSRTALWIFMLTVVVRIGLLIKQSVVHQPQYHASAGPF